MCQTLCVHIIVQASALIDEGDSYLARLLLLEVLPNDSADYPYTPEAENALRKAMQYNNAILGGHISVINSAAFSPDGKHIVSASLDWHLSHTHSPVPVTNLITNLPYYIQEICS